MHNLILLPVIALLVFCYHYERNGDPWNLGNTIARLIWAASVAVSFFIMSATNTNLLAYPVVFLTSLVAIFVPHAFAQNMGRWPATWESQGLHKYWPGFLVSKLIPETNPKGRDFFGMMSVGLLRGAVVFGPTLFLGFSIAGVLSAMVLNTLWQPLSYYIGWYVPFTLFNNPARSANWGEFGIGIGWALALAGLVWL